VLRFLKSEDQKRALLSRLLAQAACSWLVPYEDVTIRRTRGRKPFCLNETPLNFNFNVSHEGDFVVLASETQCLVGVDVCSATSLRQTKDFEELRSSFRASFAAREWRRIESASTVDEGFRFFRTFWSCKEAFVKARGDGLQFDLGRLDFSSDGVFRLDGRENRRFRFDVEHLDSEHVVAVCRGPVDAIVDSYGDFTRTMDFAADCTAAIRAERDEFRTVRVEDLLPAKHRQQLLRLRGGLSAPAPDDADCPVAPSPVVEEGPLQTSGISDNNLRRVEHPPRRRVVAEDVLGHLPCSDHPDLSTLRDDDDDRSARAPLLRCVVS